MESELNEAERQQEIYDAEYEGRAPRLTKDELVGLHSSSDDEFE